MEATTQISEFLARMEQLTLMRSKNVLTFDEVLIYTGYSRGQLYRLTSERLIPHSKRGKRLFFDKAELDRWLLQERVKTQAELEGKATTYVITHKPKQP